MGVSLKMQQVLLFRQRGRCGRRNAPAIDVGALKAASNSCVMDTGRKKRCGGAEEEEEEKFRFFT